MTLELTVQSGHVRRRAWVRVSRGLYRRQLGEDGPTSTLLAWQLALPEDACFTHLSAAVARGWPVPPLPEGVPVFASMSNGGNRPRRPGLRVSRLARPVEFDVIDGVRVASAAEILLAAARDLGLVDLVVLIDGALRLGECTTEDLLRVAGGRAAGALNLRRTLPYADPRAESAWESLLRLLHVLCEAPVRSQWEIGPFRADLRILGTRRLPEYDGGKHRDPERQARDLARECELQRRGWQRYGYTWQVVLHRGQLILRDADAALGREHDPARIRVWHRALSESLFTPAGTSRLLARWTLGPHVPRTTRGR